MSIQDYIGNPDEFPILRHWDFYNHAGVCPLPRVAAEAFRKYVAEAEQGAYLNTQWYRDIDAPEVLPPAHLFPSTDLDVAEKLLVPAKRAEKLRSEFIFHF